MKHLLALFSILLVPAIAGAQETLAFTGVHVIPMDREVVLRNQTVVVSGGAIAAMGAADRIAVPAGATRIDATGKFLMPGLAEMHGHIPSPQQGSLDFAEQVLFLYVANGVTTVRGMLGNPAHLDLKRRVAARELWGPRIWTSGPSFNGRTAPNPAAAESRVIEQKEAGYDLLKIHPGLSRAAFDALDRVADSVGIRYAGHVPTAVGVPRALEAGYWSIDHLDGYMQALVAEGAAPPNVEAPLSQFGPHLAPYVDEARITELARRTRDAGVWNVPTETLMQTYLPGITLEHFTQRPELRYMPPQWVEGWTNTQRTILAADITDESKRRFIDVRRALIRALHAEGAGLLLGSDAPQIWNVPGFSVRHELEAIVSAGLTPYEALLTGTRNVAEYFDTPEAGTIAVGNRADLILLDANPLENVSNVSERAGVVVNGRWLPKAEIDARLEQIAAQYRQ